MLYGATRGHKVPLALSLDPEDFMAPVKSYQSETLMESVVDQVHRRGIDGLTVAELRSSLDRHHGAVSGATSSLHAQGALKRLSLRRGNYRVYVTPEHVAGRVTEQQGKTS